MLSRVPDYFWLSLKPHILWRSDVCRLLISTVTYLRVQTHVHETAKSRHRAVAVWRLFHRGYPGSLDDFRSVSDAVNICFSHWLMNRAVLTNGRAEWSQTGARERMTPSLFPYKRSCWQTRSHALRPVPQIYWRNEFPHQERLCPTVSMLLGLVQVKP